LFLNLSDLCLYFDFAFAVMHDLNLTPFNRYFNFTKKGNQNNVAIQVSCGDHFTAVSK